MKSIVGTVCIWALFMGIFWCFGLVFSKAAICAALCLLVMYVNDILLYHMIKSKKEDKSNEDNLVRDPSEKNDAD